MWGSGARSHDDAGTREAGKQLFQMGGVLFRYFFESDAHAEVRIRDPHFALNLDADAVRLQFHVQQRSGGIRCLRLDIAPIQADVGEGGPGADVASLLAQLGAAFAFVAGAAPFFGALKAFATLYCG